ncbi:MAG: ComEC/Rec2 family competence protein [Pseudomonadota bacterium]
MQRFPLATVRVQAPIVFAIGMMLGAAWYFLIDFEPKLYALIAASGLSSLPVLWVKFKGAASLAIALTWAFAGITIGALSGGLATQRVAHATVPTEIGPVLLEGWVQRALPASRGVRLRLKVHAIDGLAQSQTPPIVRVTHISSLETEPGRFVRCWVVLRPPPAPVIEGDYAFDRQAWYSGLGAVGYVQGRCRGGGLGAPSSSLGVATLEVSKARRRLAQHVFDAAGEKSGGFAAALTSGDRSFMTEADQEALRGAGLAHLLAISGLHMGIVGGLVFLLVWRGLAFIEPVTLRVPVKKLAALTALLACATYLILSGASISTQRAFVMAAILFGAVLMDRTALSLRSLAIAMMIILAVAPWSVLTPGFQMSFAATGALVATYERWNRRRRNTNEVTGHKAMFWLKSLVVTSTVSSLATMPFALFHFERAAALGLIANLLAMPIISLLTAPAAAAALMLAPLGLDGLALRVFGASLGVVLDIAHFFSARNMDEALGIPQMPGVSFGILGGAILVFCLLRTSVAAWSAMGVLTIASGLYWAQSGTSKVHFAPSGDLFLESANGHVDRIAWRDGDGLGPLRFSRLTIDRDCRSASHCQLEFAGHTISLYRAEGLEEAWTLADPASNQAPLVVSWNQITGSNGLTLIRTRDGFEPKQKPDCGSRAWRVCRFDE